MSFELIVTALFLLAMMSFVVAIFKDIAHHDETVSRSFEFSQWKDDFLEAYIKNVDIWESQGMADRQDLRNQDLAKEILKKRKEESK